MTFFVRTIFVAPTFFFLYPRQWQIVFQRPGAAAADLTQNMSFILKWKGGAESRLRNWKRPFLLSLNRDNRCFKRAAALASLW